MLNNNVLQAVDADTGTGPILYCGKDDSSSNQMTESKFKLY